jgi:predicted N-acetyltransferase YhbS
VRYVVDPGDDALEQAFLHTHAIWAEGRTLAEHVAYQREQLRRATRALLSYAVLLGDDERVLASHKRFRLVLDVAGRAVPTLGIGAVMVPPEVRGRGLGRAIVEHAIAAARAEGDGLAWLFSEIEPVFYRRLGFADVEWRVDACAVDALPSPSTLAPRQVDAEDDRAWATVRDLDERGRAIAPAPIAPLRSDSARRYFAWRNAVDHVLLERGGEAVAYVALGGLSGGEGERVLEIADWGASSACAPTDLLAAIGALARGRGARFIAGVLGRAITTPAFGSFASDAHGVPMLRALDPTIRLPTDEHGVIARDAARFGLVDYF